MLTMYRNLFEKAYLYWGKKQFGMVKEENTEQNLLLEKAERYDYNMKHILSRVKENEDGSKEVEDITIGDWLVEETADDLIMQTQIAIILGEGKVWEQIEKKIDRLRERIYIIEHSKKEVICKNCDGIFTTVEFSNEMDCPYCVAKLVEVGFSWRLICPCSGQEYYVCMNCKEEKYDRSFFEDCPHNVSEEKGCD